MTGAAHGSAPTCVERFSSQQCTRRPRRTSGSLRLNPHPKKLLVHLALVLAIVLAQAGALVHAASHAGKASDTGSAAHAALCGHCLGFSTVLGAVAPDARGLVPVDADATTRCDAGTVAAVASSSPSAFWCRGPPTLR